MDGFRKAQDKGGIPGGLSFGDFSLAKQRKVTRPSGRDPTSNKPVAIATQNPKTQQSYIHIKL
ncbi:hypothetical protein [Methylomonas sp. ZR1]|uniref:hypothetical protein n=1 Tax=Methylomonas sp. ZR1 TaxID=1797072 RepID=UPI001490BF7B|nr:hypothetical protein [Methylomonas sp. ZR1]